MTVKGWFHVIYVRNGSIPAAVALMILRLCHHYLCVGFDTLHLHHQEHRAAWSLVIIVLFWPMSEVLMIQQTLDLIPNETVCCVQVNYRCPKACKICGGWYATPTAEQALSQ